jgi:peptide/nickel transport system permease protein
MYVLGWRGVIREFMRYKGGIFGLILLIFLVGLAIFAPVLSSTDVFYKWYEPTYWAAQNLPKGVPPEWINMFGDKTYATQAVLTPEISQPSALLYNITFKYEYTADIPPYDIIIDIFSNITEGSQMVIFMDIIRPDGLRIYRVVDVQSDQSIVKISLRSAVDAPKKIFVFGLQFETEETRREITEKGLLSVLNPMDVVFGVAEEGIVFGRSGPLNGEYIFNIIVYRLTEENTLNDIKLTIAGSVYGIMGTDALGRDLFGGIVWGSRIALIIGLGVAIISVAIALVYGTLSAYVGGWTDEALQRIQEFVISIPVLPLLLILAYVFTPSVWNLIFLLVIFSWPGPVKTIRSMALQIREQLYITSAKAIGLSTWRVISRYILPQILPYTFALVAFSVPGAILTEAGVSFLLGNQGALEVTWGRILNDAEKYSAVLTGMWWWVIPPGLMISIAGLAFVLVGNALDRVLNPRLLR